MKLTEQLKELKDDVLARMPKAIVDNFLGGIEDIRERGMKESALQKGDFIPDFTLADAHGKNVQLKELLHSEYLVLNFYRGGWCPYCNMELREYEKLKAEFALVNADIVGISAEVPKRAAKTSEKSALSFPVLTDVDAKFMKELGIVYQLDEEAKKNFVGFKMDFTEIHGNDNFELPVPAVYVINRKKEIVFVHFEADYMTRIEPSQVLEAIKNI